MDHLLKIATLLRAGQVYAHHAHNNAKSANFFPDHEFFGGLYPVYETGYDGCVERYIGLTGKPIDGVKLVCDGAELAEDLPKDGGSDNKAFYQGILHIEKALCAYVQDCIKSPMSEGTKQMLGTLVDESEIRQYKIRQRMK